jgi:hypothetical protein
MKTHSLLYLVLGEWNSAGHLLRGTAPHNLQRKNAHQLLVEKDVLAFHILYCNKDFHY